MGACAARSSAAGSGHPWEVLEAVSSDCPHCYRSAVFECHITARREESALCEVKFPAPPSEYFIKAPRAVAASSRDKGRAWSLGWRLGWRLVCSGREEGARTPRAPAELRTLPRHSPSRRQSCRTTNPSERLVPLRRRCRRERDGPGGSRWVTQGCDLKKTDCSL